MYESLQLAVIIGSTREGRIGPTVAHWFAEQAAGHPELDLDLIDLAEADLPATLGAQPEQRTEALGERLASADAFAVVTPEYNKSIPASLKNAIDRYFHQWHAKPVGLVSYGGVAGGLRAVEHLRLVFSELHAVTVRDTVSFHRVWDQFDDAGQPREPSGAQGAAKTLLDQLAWWGRALKQARIDEPYVA